VIAKDLGILIRDQPNLLGDQPPFAYDEKSVPATKFNFFGTQCWVLKPRKIENTPGLTARAHIYSFADNSSRGISRLVNSAAFSGRYSVQRLLRRRKALLRQGGYYVNSDLPPAVPSQISNA